MKPKVNSKMLYFLNVSKVPFFNKNKVYCGSFGMPASSSRGLDYSSIRRFCVGYGQCQEEDFDGKGCPTHSTHPWTLNLNARIFFSFSARKKEMDSNSQNKLCEILAPSEFIFQYLTLNQIYSNLVPEALF